MDGKLITLTFKGLAALHLNFATDIQVRIRTILVSSLAAYSTTLFEREASKLLPDQSKWPSVLWKIPSWAIQKLDSKV